MWEYKNKRTNVKQMLSRKQYEISSLLWYYVWKELKQGKNNSKKDTRKISNNTLDSTFGRDKESNKITIINVIMELVKLKSKLVTGATKEWLKQTRMRSK